MATRRKRRGGLSVFAFAAFVVAANIVVDLFYAVLDPRVRASGRTVG